TLPKGSKRIVSGRIERFQGRLQMPHPDYVVEPGGTDTFPLYEPVYALTEGLPAKSLWRAIQAALEKVPSMPEWIDPSMKSQRAWPSLPDALHAVHAPSREADLAPLTPARERLAYDELLANQLALLLIRARVRGPKGRALKGDGHLRGKAIAA